MGKKLTPHTAIGMESADGELFFMLLGSGERDRWVEMLHGIIYPADSQGYPCIEDYRGDGGSEPPHRVLAVDPDCTLHDENTIGPAYAAWLRAVDPAW